MATLLIIIGGIILIMEASPKVRWMFLLFIPIAIVLFLVPAAIPASFIIFICLIVLTVIRHFDK